MNRVLSALVFSFLLICSCLVCRAESITGRCIRVSDGDTITILHDDDTQEKIRLRGIDAPESGQNFGKVSKRELANLVEQEDCASRN